MYIILGATGNIGKSVTSHLLQAKQDVTVVTRNAKNAERFKQNGATIAEVDVMNTNALNKIFRTGDRAFILNPPAAPNTDTVAEEKKTMQGILRALENSGIEKVVVESTYGAQPGDGLGDLAVLYDLEEGLKKLPLTVTVIRGAYYMSNWNYFIGQAKAEGKFYTMYPVNFQIPMVAPEDIGELAARLLQEPIQKTGLYYAEGPQAYSPADVADAFTNILGRRVEAVELPQSQWKEYLINGGFSDKAADSMIEMTRITLEENYDKPSNPYRGGTTLEQYFEKVAQQQLVAG